MTERRRTYFGFELETEIEPIEGEIPSELQEAARDALAQDLWEGETSHPDQNRLRRVLADMDELWRRSGGTLKALAPDALRQRIRSQLEGVKSSADFLRTRVILDPAELVDDHTREQLEILPARLHLRGDTVPLDYEIQDGVAVARIRLREGQAKRLRTDELPSLDRPLRFAVQRGRHPPLLADTISALQVLLRRSPKVPDEEGESFRHRDGRRQPPHRRRGANRGKPRRRP
jgi:hypothetical protein